MKKTTDLLNNQIHQEIHGMYSTLINKLKRFPEIQEEIDDGLVTQIS